MLRRIGFMPLPCFAPPVEGGASSAGPGSSSPAPAAPPSSSGSSAGASSSPGGAGTTSSEGGASPSSSPAGPGGGDVSPPTSPSTDLWSGLGETDLDEVEIPAEAGEKKEEPTPEVKAEPKPEEKIPQPEVKPEPSAQPSPSQVAAGDSPLPDPAQPGMLAKSMTDNFDFLVDAVDKAGLFSLSDAEKEALETDFIGSLPKLGAKVFVRAQINAVKQLEQIIPAMIERHMKTKEGRKSTEDKFYSAWPGLDREKHGEVVTRLGRAYRQANPTATFEQMSKELGPMVMAVAGVQTPAPNGHAPANPGKQTPFTPALGGPAGAPKQISVGEWDGLGASESDED